jgi:hypothetical protein
MAVHKEVIKGHMVVARTRRKVFKPGTKKGYMYVEVLVYPGLAEEGEPVADWEMPKELPLNLAAQTAFVQTDFEEN